MAIPIFAETESVFVVDKPSGWLTTPARSADDPRPCLGRELQAQMGQTIYPVHRLDFEVSGLTVWAKNPEGHRRAQKWFEYSLVQKIYQAYSLPGKGEPPSDIKTWNSKLVRGKKRAFEADYGSPSTTLARVLEAAETWKWELVAVTGRPHQLRYEMFKHGVPILGDVLYGGAPQADSNWIALRAVELDLSQMSEAERLGLPEVLSANELTLPVNLNLALKLPPS